MKTKIIIATVILAWGTVSLSANNIQMSGSPRFVSKDIANKKITVSVDISWDNSWKLDRPNNHDAAWVFMKYRINAGNFYHANLVQAPNIVKGGASTPSAQSYGTSRTPAGTDVTTGVFLYRRDKGFGTTHFDDVQLVWDITGTNIDTNSVLSIRVFAIEMVYVPEGPFDLGDEQSQNRLVSVNGTLYPSHMIPWPGGTANTNTNDPNNIIGLMTANPTTVNGVTLTASASSVNGSYAAHQAFSGVQSAAANTFWISAAGANWHWVQIQFSDPKQANWCRISGVCDATYNPRGFYVAGSNDGTNWTPVHGTMSYFHTAQTYVLGATGAYVPIAFDRPGMYTHYRFYFYAAANDIRIYNIQMFDSPKDNINRITSEAELLYYTGANNVANSTTNYQPIPENFPKGYKAFYVMKHELTQAAYMDFLNCLTWEQQYRQVHYPTGAVSSAATFSPASAVGENLFRPYAVNLHRMNIKIRERGIDGPAVFGIGNIGPVTYSYDEEYQEEEEDAEGNVITVTKTITRTVTENRWDWNYENHGGNLPMFNLAWTDITAYLDWACLRPMTELEYEKACRGDVKYMYNEYAWGQPYLPSRVASVENRNLPDENPLPLTANYSQPEGGSVAAHTAAIAAYWPVRTGSFAREESTREEAGASYWGIMNLSDNVPERVINVSTAQGRAFTGEHGDGNITPAGLSNVSGWPSQTAAIASNNALALGTGYRGIDVNSYTIYIPRQVSYRGGIDAANYNQNMRDYWTGCRGVRTAQ